MKPKKKRDPLRTEAAIKRAVKLWAQHNTGLHVIAVMDEPYSLAFHMSGKNENIAIADLRDLYRKRSA